MSGNNVWIHDVSVWNQDDCVCVKHNASNMLFERIEASGMGLTIGSIGHARVRNITFRDCTMPSTYKGLCTPRRKVRTDPSGEACSHCADRVCCAPPCVKTSNSTATPSRSPA